MQRGRIYGYEKIWYANGMLKSQARHAYGVCLTFKKWNNKGKLIEEKSKPTEDNIKMRNIQEERYKRTIGGE